MGGVCAVPGRVATPASIDARSGRKLTFSAPATAASPGAGRSAIQRLVRTALAHGAPLEARDRDFDSAPLGWAI
jgi:hypothetical protein